MSDFFRKLRFLPRRRGFDADLDDEVRFHIEERADELAAEGVPRDAALARARREFGGGGRMREQARDAWTFGWLEDWCVDTARAARSLRKQPGFVLAAVLSLALGIGANTTIFGITSEFLFSSPSVRDPGTLAILTVGGSSHARNDVYQFVRDAQAFPGVAGYNEETDVNWRSGEETYRLSVLAVSDNYFDVLGVPLAMGRGMRTGETQTVVVSHRFWQSRLASDPLAVGRALIVNGRAHTVVGVLPENHRTLVGFGFAPELLVPAEHARSLRMVARLTPEMNPPEVYGRLQNLAQALDRVYPHPGHSYARNLTVSGVGGLDRLRNMGVQSMVAFFGVLGVFVGLILLIACANVSSLLLARAASRRHELCLRASLGAGRGRLIRQMLAETLLLSLGGAAAGLSFNLACAHWLSRLSVPLPIPIQLRIEPDLRLLAFCIAVTVASSLMAGLFPAFRATRLDLGQALKAAERQVGGGNLPLRRILLAGQIAVSVVLLMTGLLFLRNLYRASALDVGFRLDTVWARVSLAGSGENEPRSRILAERALEQVRAYPGVESAAVARVVPFNDNMVHGDVVSVEGTDRRIHLNRYLNIVTPDYFRTMGIPLLRGRDFSEADRAGSGDAEAAILNQHFARKLFPGEDPLGRRIRIGSGTESAVFQIVGVAGNIKHFTVGEEEPLAFYRSLYPAAPCEPIRSWRCVTNDSGTAGLCYLGSA